MNQPDRRAQLSETLWRVAEQTIVAEWICCDPINPDHKLCSQGGAALSMVRALLVDDPTAWKPAAPLLDAILAQPAAQSPDRPFRDEPTEVLQAALDLANTHAQQAARFRPQQPGDALPAVADLFQAELQHREGQTPADRAEDLVHVGWWCWRGDNHGHLATMACRSDNVPIHVPQEWADEMRAVLRRLEDDEDDAEPAAQSPADRADEELCVCGEPETPDTVHRTDGPCYVADRAVVRAEALREAADHYARQGKVVVSAPQVAAELRRLAGEQPAQDEAPTPRCTCADAGDCFAPAGHYADCPLAAPPTT